MSEFIHKWQVSIKVRRHSKKETYKSEQGIHPLQYDKKIILFTFSMVEDNINGY